MAESIELRIGEERPVRLPAVPERTWSAEVSGMASAVDVRKLWAADPYPDDEEDEERDEPPSEVVFMVRAVAPGHATVRFTAPGGGAEAREVRVRVSM
jgi:hypothetical protein